MTTREEAIRLAEEAGPMSRNGLDFTTTRPLYATPHEAIIATLLQKENK